MFTVTILNVYGYTMGAELILTSYRTMLDVYASDEHQHQSTMTVLLECDEREQVRVHCTSSGEGRMYGDSAYRENMFSGVLLHPF